MDIPDLGTRTHMTNQIYGDRGIIHPLNDPEDVQNVGGRNKRHIPTHLVLISRLRIQSRIIVRKKDLLGEACEYNTARNPSGEVAVESY